MPHEIITVANSDHLIIRDQADTHNALTLTDHRDLLRLRARINHYLDTLQDDGQIAQPPIPLGEMITAQQARHETAQRGHPLEEATLRMAMTRGTIPGAEKRGGRWWLPRHAFEEWLQGHLHRR